MVICTILEGKQHSMTFGETDITYRSQHEKHVATFEI